MADLKLGTADWAIQTILRAWFTILETDVTVWNSALSKFPDEIVAEARLTFLSGKYPLQVITGYPFSGENPPVISVVLLGESPEHEYMGQTEGVYETMGEDPTIQVGNITNSQVGVLTITTNRIGIPQVYSELTRIGCLIAQKAMLDVGFLDMKFISASDLLPQEIYLPAEYWVRSYTYSVMEENNATIPIGDDWVPSLVHVALAAILEEEPPNEGGVTPVTE